MKKNNIIAIGIATLVVILLFNIQISRFYFVFFGNAQLFFPEELVEVSYANLSIPELQRGIAFTDEADLERWSTFIEQLDEANFEKVRSKAGTSYCGAILSFQFEGVEKEFVLTYADAESMAFEDKYVWKPSEAIELPYTEEELIELGKKEIE